MPIPDNQLSENFLYCLAFLRNGGERIRAVRLTMDTLRLDVAEAQRIVDSACIRIPGHPINYKTFCPHCNVYWLKGTIHCPLCDRSLIKN